MASKQPQLLMRRPHLEDLAQPAVPPGYELRHFRSGDEGGWNRLMDIAFERTAGQSDFAREMAADAPYRAERVRLIFDRTGTVVATASCWQSARYPAHSMVLHWVATEPSHGGRGLGTAVSLDALHQGVREHQQRAFLQTDDFRIPAIRTYLRLGFEPVLTDDSHAPRWHSILSALSWPEGYEAQLAGPLEAFPVPA